MNAAYELKLSQLAEILKTHDFNLSNPGLLQGELGRLLFLFYYAEHTGSRDDFDYSMDRVEDFLESVDLSTTTPCSFSGGFAGLAWFIEHIHKRGWLETDTNEILGELDEQLYEWMMNQMENDNYDFLHGAIGVAFYFIQRLDKNPQARKYLEQFVLLLNSKAVRTDKNQTKWFFIDLYDHAKQHQLYNLGLAHGMPSILMFLSKAWRVGIAPVVTKDLLSSTVNYIVANQWDAKTNHSFFPYSIADGAPTPGPMRVAWCYCDLGVGCALWQAAHVLEDEVLKEFVITMLINASSIRSLELARINEAPFCHGSAGVAHIFQRFYDFTGRSEFQDAATFWYEQTLGLATFDDGLAGYKTFFTPEFGGWRNDYSLIAGISGIAITLLYKISGKDPLWEEVFFIV